MLIIDAAEGFRRPGRILQALLPADGLTEAYVNYGKTTIAMILPTLNSNAGRLNKLQQGKRLEACGIPVVQHLTPQEAIKWVDFPLIARSLSHTRGKDIMLAFEQLDVAARCSAGAEFFTVYEPSDLELRVWTYRNKHLATYKKELVHPEKYKKFGRNYGNGWAMNLLRQDEVDLHRQAIEISGRAVRALDLDFGAVDVLVKDTSYLVLEVNSAPGVEGEGRQGIVNLAKHITNWKRLGFPERRTLRPARNNA